MDFVAQYGASVKYYQVSATVMDEKTQARELASFKKINDNYPKILLTLDDIIVNRDYDGILHLNVLKWLLGEDSEIG